MDRIVNASTPLYVTNTATDSNYFVNNAYYQAQIAQLQSQIQYAFENFVSYECIAALDSEYDELDFGENTAEELNEFINTFKIRGKGGGSI